MDERELWLRDANECERRVAIIELEIEAAEQKLPLATCAEHRWKLNQRIEQLELARSAAIGAGEKCLAIARRM